MFRSLCVLGGLCLALALVGFAGAADDKHAALIGKPAPDLKGDFALNGTPVALSDLKGKVVLVDFWAVWCGPCIATFPHLKEWNKEYKDRGLEIVGVTMYNFENGRNLGFDKTTGKLTRADKVTKDDEQTLLKNFVEHHKLDHRIMALPSANYRKASADYSANAIPTAVLIDRKGMVRMVKVGSGEANAKALEAEIKKLLDEK